MISWTLESLFPVIPQNIIHKHCVQKHLKTQKKVQNTKSTKKRENCKNMWNWKTPKQKKSGGKRKKLDKQKLRENLNFWMSIFNAKIKKIYVIVKWDYFSDFLTLCYKLCIWNANVKAVF